MATKNWVLDASHSDIQFKVKHLMITTVTGSFRKFNGTVTTEDDDITTAKVNFTADGNYPVVVSGELSIHGVTNKVTASGTISVSAGVITATSKFPVKLADYKISIPGVVKDNISEVVDVNVSCVYDKKMN